MALWHTETFDEIGLRRVLCIAGHWWAMLPRQESSISPSLQATRLCNRINSPRLSHRQECWIDYSAICWCHCQTWLFLLKHERGQHLQLCFTLVITISELFGFEKLTADFPPDHCYCCAVWQYWWQWDHKPFLWLLLLERPAPASRYMLSF